MRFLSSTNFLHFSELRFFMSCFEPSSKLMANKPDFLTRTFFSVSKKLSWMSKFRSWSEHDSVRVVAHIDPIFGKWLQSRENTISKLGTLNLKWKEVAEDVCKWVAHSPSLISFSHIIGKREIDAAGSKKYYFCVQRNETGRIDGREVETRTENEKRDRKE